MLRTLILAALLIVTALPATAGFKEGLAAYKRGDYRTALREFKRGFTACAPCMSDPDIRRSGNAVVIGPDERHGCRDNPQYRVLHHNR